MLSVSRFICYLTFLLLPLGSPHGHANPATTSAASAILALCRTCQVLILGERHRQPESTALFLDLVTRSATQGERILVGLEITASKQEALDAVMAGQHTPEGIAHPIIDSPTYQAMLLAFAQLHQTQRVAVVALDDLESDKRRDEAMADTITTHFASGQYDRAVVLVGNLHAIRKMRWAEDAWSKAPYFAELLAAAGLRVTSVMQDLDMACDRLRQPMFYPITDKEGLEAAQQRIAVTKMHPEMDVSKVVDGVVVWRCQQ